VAIKPEGSGMTLDQLFEAHGIKLSERAAGRYYTTCPRCSSTRRKAHQNNKVLGINIKDDGSANWGCNHCGWTGPEKGTGGNGREPDVTYDYQDASGALVFQKVRTYKKDGERVFWIRKPDGHGGFVLGAKGTDTKLLYRRPEVDAAIKAGSIIAVAEGEKDVVSLWRIGIAATCNVGGAHKPGQQPKWYCEHSEQLRGAHVVIFNDNDDQGRAHAEAVAQSLSGVAKRVQRLDLAQHWPSMPEKADISDWLAQGHERAELDQLIEGAPDYVSEAEEPQGEAQPDQNGNAEDAELERLAKLGALEYERARGPAAEQLGIKRVSILDKLVAAKRAELGLDADDDLQGGAISFEEPQPWPHPVDGAELLTDVADAIRRYVVMSDHCCDTVALWVAHSYLTEHFLISPRLAIMAPTKGCGKTTLLDVVARLVRRPLAASSLTASVVFRVISKHSPTLLIDEADNFVRADGNDELRGVLNAGHRKGGAVLRNVGDEHEPRSFTVYGAVAIALIGELPGTLADRSVTVELKRKLPSEKAEPFRLDRTEHLDLVRKIARWAQDNAEAIRAADPQMPEGMYNRAADNWRPLLAIADVAGGEWPQRARAAATAGKAAEATGLELLLADIHAIFEASDHLERIASTDLAKRLIDMDDRPWAEMWPNDKPITPNRIARMLAVRGVAITPKQIRFSPTDSRKGYERWQFDEAFRRFLGVEPKQRNNADGSKTNGTFATETPDQNVSVVKSQKPNNDGQSIGVSVAKGENGKESVCEAVIDPETVMEPALDPRFRIVGGVDPDVACIQCGGAYGQVFKIKDTQQLGAKPEPLHEGCAQDWFDLAVPAYLKRVRDA
jgi:putative DNA primase/helicase